MVRAAMTQAKAPSPRPTWVTMMASMMLLYGGLTLVSALFTLREPRAAAVAAIENVAHSVTQPEVQRRLDAINDVVLAHYRRAIRIGAFISVGVALFTLYAVAAILSRDRHGRLLALGAGAVGIVYEIGGLPYGVAMARLAAVDGAPLLAKLFIDSGQQPAGTNPVELAAKLQVAMVAPPIVSSLLGIAWCVAMMIYFGGRRGRAVYGLDAPAPGPGA
jgi:hypothetical protein